MYTIKQVTNWPIEWVRNYVKAHTTSNDHYYISVYELRLLALKIMDDEGELDPNDSQILNTPTFGDRYVYYKGNMNKVMEDIGVDLLPGASLLRII